VFPNELQEVLVDRVHALLRRIMNEVPEKLRKALIPSGGSLVVIDGRSQHLGVSHADHVASFGSVIGGNGHLTDAVALMLQFDDDLHYRSGNHPSCC
jgi:hypothetical protein